MKNALYWWMEGRRGLVVWHIQFCMSETQEHAKFFYENLYCPLSDSDRVEGQKSQGLSD